MKSCLYFSLLSSFVFTGTVYAACTPSPDCASLGYTATSCPNGGVKCPFDTTLWHCDKGCEDFGFKYTCTGTNEIGGAGTSCDDKFTACNCAADYNWKLSSCQKQIKKGFSCCEDGTEWGAICKRESSYPKCSVKIAECKNQGGTTKFKYTGSQDYSGNGDYYHYKHYDCIY